MVDSVFDNEGIAHLVAQSLRGEMPIMAEIGFRVCALDIGEVYLLSSGGERFRLIVEPVSADDWEGWGIDEIMEEEAA